MPVRVLFNAAQMWRGALEWNDLRLVPIGSHFAIKGWEEQNGQLEKLELTVRWLLHGHYDNKRTSIPNLAECFQRRSR